MSYQITFGPRVRKSPFFDCTVADGVRHFTIYNQMYMPTGYSDPQAEYRRLLEGVSMWDVAAERQVEIKGRDVIIGEKTVIEGSLSARFEDPYDGSVRLPGGLNLKEGEEAYASIQLDDALKSFNQALLLAEKGDAPWPEFEKSKHIQYLLKGPVPSRMMEIGSIELLIM